jgi:HEPN domain-containing protein
LTFSRDPDHWLYKLAPREWIAAAMNELARAEEAYGRNDVRAGLAGAKRAAGMALNGALIVRPNEAWGRSYVDHVRGLAKDASAPDAVRRACDVLLCAAAPGSRVVGLRTRSADEKVLEAARDVMAHALAIVMRGEE